MNFPKPATSGYTIYTKKSCSFCTKAKFLLSTEIPKPNIISCDEYLTDPQLKTEFLNFIQTLTGGISHRTFPIVFYNGIFIGGYSQLEEYYETQFA